MKQEVRVQLDVSLTVDAKHSDAKVRDIVESGIRNAWPNNYKYIHDLRYAEERHIYQGKRIRWQTIFARLRPHPNAVLAEYQPSPRGTPSLTNP
jgi:hypothetical protein